VIQFERLDSGGEASYTSCRFVTVTNRTSDLETHEGPLIGAERLEQVKYILGGPFHDGGQLNGLLGVLLGVILGHPHIGEEANKLIESSFTEDWEDDAVATVMLEPQPARLDVLEIRAGASPSFQARASE
jgi:hypothetical protein